MDYGFKGTLKTLGLGAALGVAGLATIMHLRKSSQALAVPAVTPLSGADQSGIGGLVIIGLLGAAGWFVWSKYISKDKQESSEEIEEDIFENPKKPHKTRGKSHSSGSGYFVRVSGTKQIWPKPGTEYYPRGYPLRKAQDFARIGSQTGEPRKVLRGGPNGVVIRKYVDGKRVWPKTVAQASSLKPIERPSKLRKAA